MKKRTHDKLMREIKVRQKQKEKKETKRLAKILTLARKKARYGR